MYCTSVSASDYVKSLCAALLVGSVAVRCESLTSFIIQPSSKPGVPKLGYMYP